MSKRVVVTGLGAVTPVGNDAPSTWRAAVEGAERNRLHQSFDASAFPVRVAAEVKGFDPEGLASPKELRRLDDCVLFALAASKEAVADAGLDSAYDPARVGIVYGSAIGGIKTINQQVDILRDRGPDRVSPHWLPNSLVDSASGQIAITLGYRGPNYADGLGLCHRFARGW